MPGIVAVVGGDAVWERERSTSANFVVRDGDGCAALCDRRQLMGRVVLVRNRRLPRNGHRRPPAVRVVGVGYGACRRRLHRDAVERVVLPGQCPIQRINDLYHAVAGVVCVRDRGSVGERRDRQPIQRVVLVGGGLPLAIDGSRQIVVEIVLPAFSPRDGVGSRGEAIEGIVGVTRRVTLGHPLPPAHCRCRRTSTPSVLPSRPLPTSSDWLCSRRTAPCGPSGSLAATSRPPASANNV